MKLKAFTLRADEELWRSIREIARTNDRSMAGEILHVLRLYVRQFQDRRERDGVSQMSPLP